MPIGLEPDLDLVLQIYRATAGSIPANNFLDALQFVGSRLAGQWGGMAAGTAPCGAPSKSPIRGGDSDPF
jgi:hypothetical protein